MTKYSTRLAVIFMTIVLSGCACVLSVPAQDDPAEQAVALFNHAQDLHEKGDLHGALAEYDKALRLLPEFPEAEYQRAAAEITLGDLAEAEASLHRAVKLREDWSLAYAMLGDVLVRKYFHADLSERPAIYANAESALRRAIELDTSNAPAYAALVELQVNSGGSPEVLRGTLAKIAALTDGKAAAAGSLWAARAVIENALGDRKIAKISIGRALTSDPKNVSALLLSSDIALAEEDIERAKQVSIRLSEIGADPARTTILNARIAATEGRVSDAFALLDKLPPAYSAGTDLRKRLVAATTIDPAEIENQLTSAPKDPQLLGRLCTLYRRSQPGKALEYCRRASEIEPTNMVPAAGYAAALVQLKQFDSAANMLSKLVLIEPDNRTLHANLGTALFELKRFDLAAKQFEWLSASDPTAAAPYYFLAIAYDQTENYVDSLAAYEQYKKLADPVSNKLEIEKVDLRLPVVRGLVKAGKGRKKQ